MYYVFPFGKVSKGSKVILYGAGNAGRNFLDQIRQNDYCQVLFFVDLNYDKFSVEGMEVKNPECLKDTEFDYLVISILDYQIRSQVNDLMMNLGIPNEKIVYSFGSEMIWERPLYKRINNYDEGCTQAKWLDEDIHLDQQMQRKAAVAIHAFLNENDKTVLDLGVRQEYIKNLLVDSVKYIPVGIESTCDNAIVCDLSKDEFPDVYADAAIMADLLNDVDDPVKLIEACCQRVNKVIVSYQIKKTLKDQKESVHTTEDIIDLFNRCGFIITAWNSELENAWPLLACFEKATPNNLKDNYFCSGCGACKSSCRQEAICLQPDEHGYLKPHVDAIKCVNCGHCVDVCPAIKYDYINEKNPAAYALMASDLIRKNCSSGGAFVLMAQKILEQGGTVFGAAWTADFSVHHVGIKNPEELERLQYSKFVQSNTENTFSEVKQLLDQGKKVLYVGCPCQIAGLDNYLNKKYDSLVTVDLVCFCNGGSQLTFKKYLSENFDVDSIADINFRNKDVTGWSCYGYKIVLKNGEVIYKDNTTDMYQYAFHEVLLRNKTCEKCRYSGFPRVGDITIGDAWGIDLHKAEWNDQRGTSLMLANNQTGQAMIDAIIPIAKKAEQIPIRYLLNKGNRIGPGWKKGHVAADDYNSLMNQGMTYNNAVNMALTGWHDIGLVCFLCDNYGNNLTNYALYVVMQQMGYRVLMIDVPIEYGGFPVEEKLSLYAKRRIPLYDFAGDCLNKNDLAVLNEKVATFVLGSDQTLRGSFVENMKYHICLDWAQADKSIICYAGSFGTNDYDASRTVLDAQKLLLNRFDKISVREETGVTLLKKEFGIDADLVMDPVFLMNMDKYEELARQGRVRLNKSKFIGAYILDDCQERREILSYVAKCRNADEVHIITDAIKGEELQQTTDNEIILDNASVEEWVANIYYADYVVTDSFHGICMCLMFNIPFIVVYNSWQWRGMARINSILKLFNMEYRLIDCLDEKRIKEAIQTEPDYSKINSTLSKETDRSRKWLKANLDFYSKQTKEKDGFDHIRDIYIEEYQKLKRK